MPADIKVETAATIDRVLKARSVAIVGASSDSTKFGYTSLATLIKGGYEGRIYPVNPKGGRILGLEVLPSLEDIPGELDLAFIIVPARFVPDVVRQAGAKGAAAAMVASGGFREAGRPDLEKELCRVAHQAGMRLIGPNLSGISYLPNKMCAMFFPALTTLGPLAVISQSGSVTNGVAEWAEREKLGVSAVINLGNQADLGVSDYLDYFAKDEYTAAIALYIEGLTDSRPFLDTLARVSRIKPVVVLKSGRSSAGQRSAASHTGSLAGQSQVFAAACRQCGALMAEGVEDLYDLAKGLALIRPPRGRRVVSISTSGGAGTLAGDVTDLLGLEMPLLPEPLQAELARSGLSPLAGLDNPVDLVSVAAQDFDRAARIIEQAGVADVLLMNFADPVAGAVDLVKDLNRDLRANLVVSYFAGGEEEGQARPEFHRAGFAVYPAPERAMRGIWAAAESSRLRRAAGAKEATPDRFSRITVPARRPGGRARFLPEPEAARILSDYGVPYPDHFLAANAEEAVRAAEWLGFPVVLKVVSPRIIHKSEAGGVATDLADPPAVEKAYNEVLANARRHRPEARPDGVLVCRQAEPGVEMIVGAVQDQVFGPTVMCGLGGVFAEVLKDVSFRVVPFDRSEAMEMVRELKGWPLLTGARGRPPADLDALADLLLAVGRLVEEHGEIMELDLNPVRVYREGLLALDVRLMVEDDAD
ncbi:MAG: acetate--CoA ligase family protein [Thermodesulfobacteriota bacterium]